MKRIHIALLGLLIGMLPDAHGTTVGFGTLGTVRTFNDESGALLGTANSLVLVGNFLSETFTFNPLVSIATNVQAITTIGGWKQFGLDADTGATDPGVVLPGITITSAGKLTGTVADTNAGLRQAGYFNGKNLYLWVFNAASVSSATQMGIFRSPDAAQAWIFATAGTVGDSITYSVSTSGAPNVNPIGLAGTTSGTQLRLVSAVPEPSVLALGGMAALGMLASRKRGMKK